MEGATNERAARLTSSLNGHIQQLSAQLEGAVNEALQVGAACMEAVCNDIVSVLCWALGHFGCNAAAGSAHAC